MSAEQNMQKVGAGLLAVNAHEVEAFVRLLEPGFKLHVMLKPEQLLPTGQMTGPEGFGGYLRMLFTAFPDLHVEELSLRGSGGMVHQQVIVHGTHRGELTLPNGVKVPPTGIRMDIPVEVFHTFNAQGGFIGSTGYANLLDVMKYFKL